VSPNQIPIEEGNVSETPTELPEPDPTLSLDAADSSYAEAEQPEENPPLGPASVQTLGKPGVAAKRTAKKASSSSES
jgi:hypothetical protein